MSLEEGEIRSHRLKKNCSLASGKSDTRLVGYPAVDRVALACGYMINEIIEGG